jgi:hypothetical protein
MKYLPFGTGFNIGVEEDHLALVYLSCQKFGISAKFGFDCSLKDKTELKLPIFESHNRKQGEYT